MTLTDDVPYAHVANELRSQINAGLLQPDSKLPTENELIKRYGMSRVTVRAALRLLACEGLVYTKMGKGTFVRQCGRPSRTEPRGIRRGIDGHTDISAARRMTLATEPTRRREEASPDLAVELDLPMLAPLYGYHRLLTDESGWRLAHSLYLPLAICTGVAELAVDPYREPDDLYAILADAGHDLRWVETVMARNPSPDQASALRAIPHGTPMLVVRRFTQDARTGRRLAMEETRLAADSAQLSYEL